jgi:hypothetical protein
MAALAWIAIFTAAAAADDAPEFRWSRKVELPAIDETALVAIPLDSSFFAATQMGFADVRLRDVERRNVAYVIRQAPTTKERTVRKSWIATQTGAKPLESGGLEIFLELDKDAPVPQGLQVISPLRDFEHRIRVFASDDGTTWQPISPSEAIFDYSRFVDARNDRAPFEAGEHRRFRLVIDDVTAEQASQLLELTRRLRGDEEVGRDERTTIRRRPFRVDRIEFYRYDVAKVASGVEAIAYPTSDFRVSQDEKKKQTLVEFHARREPLSLVSLKTEATNFSRAVALQVPRADQRGREGGAEDWQTLATAIVSRFSLANLQKNEVAIHFPQQRHERYRLVLENRDSPPLELTGVAAEGPAYQIVFLAAPSEQLTLEYGSPEAPRATYDTAALQASLTEGHAPALATLGDAVENTAVPASEGFRWSSLFDDSRVVLGVIAVLTAVLGWGLYRASRRLESTPPRQ